MNKWLILYPETHRLYVQVIIYYTRVYYMLESDLKAREIFVVLPDGPNATLAYSA